MTELTKKYNSYFDQFEMFLHPNVVQGFKKIHNEILKAEVNAAKKFKPSPQWMDAKKQIDKIKKAYPKELKPLLIKSLLKMIESLPDENWD